MPVTIACEHCGANFRVASKFLGRRGKCPKCEHVFLIESPSDGRVAEPSDSATKPSSPSTSEQILAAFEGPIPKVRSTLLYRLHILLVAFGMVLLPLIYIGLIGLAGFAVYYHAINHTAILGSAQGGRGSILVFLVYIAPMVVGPILIAFMIKPLFARGADDQKTRSVTREGEPLLFALVDRVCEAVGSSKPTRIDLDCQVNASASFRRGMMSFLSNDLVLTIGMPLVAGLSVRQFAGVLAHEFGHFSQGAGMRLSYVIRSISHWFLRVVYERDVWDQWLATSAGSLDFRLAWVLYLAMLAVWVTRQVLWLLMWFGFLISGGLLRQMEFDADRYEARLAGSDTFAETARQLMVLNVAMQEAQGDLGDYYRDGKLGDDVPALVVSNMRRMPTDVHKKIDEVIADSKTGLFDTHPADKDRIANAAAEQAEGVFRLELPAAVLFDDFEAQSKSSTWEWYRSIFGNELRREVLHPVEEIQSRQQRDDQAKECLRRYFQGTWRANRPLLLPADDPIAPANPKETATQLKAVRQKMVVAALQAGEVLSKLIVAREQVSEAAQVAAMLRAGVALPKNTFRIEYRSVDHAKQVAELGKRTASELTEALREFDTLAGQRLHLALSLLHVPKVAACVPEAREWQMRCGQLLPSLKDLQTQLPTILDLVPHYTALSTLVGFLEGEESNESLVGAITSLMDKVQPMIVQIREILERTDYPFDHAQEGISLGEYLIATAPHQGDLGGIYQALQQLYDRLPVFSGRLTGELVTMAEEVEHAIGLAKLTAPAEESGQ